jgi:hypothetical protein
VRSGPGRRSRALTVLLALLAGLAAGAACSSDGDEGDAAAFCERLDRLSTNDPFQAFGDRVGTEEVRVAFASLREQAEDLAAVAPAEIAPAARDYAGAVDALDSLLAGAGYDGAAVDGRAYRSEQVRYQRGADRLLRHLDSAC